MTSSVISFAYFTFFPNLNISRTNTDIYKRQTGFLSFHGILCDTLKKSRGKNLIIVPLVCTQVSAEINKYPDTQLAEISHTNKYIIK